MATVRDSVKKVSGNHIEFRPIQSQAGSGLHSRGSSFNGCCSIQKGVHGSLPHNKKVKVVFVLGGPGSGKGTQCANIVEHFGYTHLSAGDLLRAEIKSGSQNGIMIQRMIKEGKIVPPGVTIALLQRAIQETENDKFLIDGFPRNEENREAFERITGIQPDFVLFFDCTEEEMARRLLNRNQGREDDNIVTIRKRFNVFKESTLPVIEYYKSKGKVQKIDAVKPPNEVFEAVKAVFTGGKVKQRCNGLDKVNIPCYAWRMMFRRSIV
ncbi:UMP-CMP kinase 3-like [Ipomoea triloba]|uniref:UMP-CMP kinase 3-like n=1 Tax=Ipomoea triloba TaxID=35885 RepID=UPI00125D1BEB|nr:UMP-CMP kinase 3-like [Ipomoea triloba]